MQIYHTGIYNYTEVEKADSRGQQLKHIWIFQGILLNGLDFNTIFQLHLFFNALTAVMWTLKLQ